MPGDRSYLKRRPEFQNMLTRFLHPILWFQFPRTKLHLKTKHTEDKGTILEENQSK